MSGWPGAVLSRSIVIRDRTDECRPVGSVSRLAPGRFARRVYRGIERRLVHRVALDRRASEIWIDVGAHLGERTLGPSFRRRRRRVYAFEPDLETASRLMAASRSYVVLPMAVAEEDGCRTFHVNSASTTSSLLPLDLEGLRSWPRGAELREIETRTVPTIRLDTFMNRIGIDHVSYLKVDAQGADLSVVRSAGRRLCDISRIEVEVAVSDKKPYLGASSMSDMLEFMNMNGFALVAESEQTDGWERNMVFEQRGPRREFCSTEVEEL